MRRTFFKVLLGFVFGATIVLLLEPELREKLWKEIVKETETVSLRFKEFQEKISEAVGAGKEEVLRKEKELEREVLKKEEESPNYIV